MPNEGGGNMGAMNVCKCPHHKTMPVLIVIFALLFLLHALGWFITDHILAVTWPIVVGLAGIFRMSERKCTCC